MIAAAREGHYAVGYELNTLLVLYSRLKAVLSGVHHRTEFHKKDLWKVSFKLQIPIFRLSHSQVDVSEYRNIIFFGVESMVS